MHQSDYLFIINPISGGFSKQALYDFISEQDCNDTFFHEIYETTGQNDEDALRKILSNTRFNMVIVAGGDGTLLLAARLLINTGIPIGLIPFGSANGMARELGIPRDFERLRSIIPREKIRIAWSIIQKRNAQTIDLIKINRLHYCLHLSDIGLNAELVKRFEAEKIRGYKAYVKQFLKELRHKRDIKYKVWTDGKKHKGHAYMICIANARMYGSGAVINPTGKLNDGMFEVCVIKRIHLGSLMKALLSIFRKNVKYQERDLKTYRCRNAIIRLKKKKTLQIDGEIMGDFDRLETEIVPNAIQILT
jgi:diacylglycerol kinase family enzyme